MKQKKLFVLTILLSLVLLLPMIIATPSLNEIFDDGVSDLTITITQDSAQSEIFFDTSGTSFDEHRVLIENEEIGGTIINKIDFSFLVSEFIGDINGEVEVERNSNVAQVNSLNVNNDSNTININNISIDGFSLYGGSFSTKGLISTIINNIDGFNLNLDNLTEINIYLQNNPLPISSTNNIVFTKSGNTYTTWTDEGFGNLDDTWKNHVRNQIENGVQSMNLHDLFVKLTPFLNEQNDTLNNYGLSSAFFDGLDIDYVIGNFSLSNVELSDGIYTVSVPIESADGSESVIKDITLILEGIKHIDDSVNVSEGTYIPSTNQPEISEFVSSIKGLNATKIKVQIFDTFNSQPSNIQKTFKYLNMTPDNPSSSATINFKIKTSEIDNPNLVNFYRLNNGNWNKLSTSITGTSGDYTLFSAQTPGFSIFLIAEDQAISSGGGSSSDICGDGILDRPNDAGFFEQCDDGNNINGDGCSSICTIELDTQPSTTSGSGQPNPINLGLPESEPEESNGFFATITGAFIGTLGTGGSIIMIIFLISVVGLIIVLRMKRKNESEELNFKGDRE